MAPTKLREKECDVYIYFVPRMEHMTLIFFLNNMTPKLFSFVQIFHGIRSSLGKSLLKNAWFCALPNGADHGDDEDDKDIMSIIDDDDDGGDDDEMDCEEDT